MTDKELNQALKNLQELIDKRKNIEIFKDSINEIKFGKKNKWQYLLSIFLSVLLAILISNTKYTGVTYVEITDKLLDLSVAFIAMILGAYSIFQALMSQELVRLLIKSDGNLLKKSNQSFLYLVILFVGDIILNFTIICVLKVLPEDFLLFENLIFSNIIAMILIFLHLLFNLLLILEVVTFALNLYRMFCVYNTLQAAESIADDQEEK